MTNHPLSGIYGASITPLKQDFTPDLEAIPEYLSFLAERGCHGALLLGTTGEGPSFREDERISIFIEALKVKEEHPDFKLLAGTGTPSLTETISLTKNAFNIGFDGVVCLPPYYYHQASKEGLYAWFCEIINRAVPRDGYLFGYHIPAQSGVPLPLELLLDLKHKYKDRFAGIKDSSGDPEHTILLSEHFGKDLVVLVGSDTLLTHSLMHQGSGCITALANLYSPDLRSVWDSYLKNQTNTEAQDRLTIHRNLLLKYTPYPPTIKALLAHFYDFPHWDVRPPLLKIPHEIIIKITQELALLN